MSLSLAPVFLLFFSCGRKERSVTAAKAEDRAEEKKLCLPPPHLSTYPLSLLLPSGPFWAARPRSGRTCPYDHLGGPKKPGAQTAVFRRRCRRWKIVNLSDDDEDSLSPFSISLPKKLLVSDVTTTTSTYVIIAFPLSLSLHHGKKSVRPSRPFLLSSLAHLA